jgi:transcription factor C subunit 6
VWQQTWFTHEWIPGGGQTENGNGGHPHAIKGRGVSRFYDGFKAEIPNTSKLGATLEIGVFEEATAITALAWNPNKGFAGWASAGMGSGLIRVEDLSI